jgi:hypothetical protein
VHVHHMLVDAHVGGDCTTCLLMCDTLASLAVHGGPLRSRGHIRMHPLSTPTNVAIWKHFCNIHLKQVKHLQTHVCNICV